jgi:hypothetical protein
MHVADKSQQHCVACAGMSIAFEVLRCLELLGATPTGRDLEVLVEGAVAESNADVALELSDRWGFSNRRDWENESHSHLTPISDSVVWSTTV